MQLLLYIKHIIQMNPVVGYCTKTSCC